MQLVASPHAGQVLPLHSFYILYRSDAAIPTPLLNTSTYKYLGIHVCSSGNPANYMKPARNNILRAHVSQHAAALYIVV